MSNIDSTDKDVSILVKAKQRCVRNMSVRIPLLDFEALKTIIKIVKIIAEYCIWLMLGFRADSKIQNRRRTP